MVRRVVVGKSNAGKSVVVSDGPSPREFVHEHRPGFVTAPLWMTSGTPDVVDTQADPMTKGGSILPTPGQATFVVITYPPSSSMSSPAFRPDLAAAEHLVAAPGIAETFEPDHPGMHTTPTLDFGCVLNGTIHLELDDGQMIRLDAGDTVVQQGTRHAWRNLGTEPAIVAFVLLGATAA